MKPGEVQKATIHNVEGACFQRDYIQDVDLVEFSVGDVDKSRDTAPQIQQGMETHSPLGLSESCPGKEGQAQVDGRGIQGIDRVLEFHGQRFLLVEFPGNADQMVGKIGIDAPVPHLVGFRQGTAGDLAADAHMIELVALCPEASLDVPQALPIGQLCEGHDAKLIHAGEMLHAEIALILRDATLKGFQRHEVHDLGKHKRA